MFYAVLLVGSPDQEGDGKDVTGRWSNVLTLLNCYWRASWL